MKNLRIFFLTLLIGLLASELAHGQSPRHHREARKHQREIRKQQHELSWEEYQRTWYRKEVSVLKDARREVKRSAAAPKKSERRKAKLVKLRKGVSNV
jgi:hypothetical protein